MPPGLLILEDDADRKTRFLAAAPRLGLTPQVWRGAFDMLAELETFLPTARLVTLDNDPDPDLPPGTPDPGEGIDVARWLAARSPVCPVIIHTSNTLRGDAMEGELELAGWRSRRVAPIGDDWIEVDWYLAAKKLLRRKDARR
jgi:hypothetical protein